MMTIEEIRALNEPTRDNGKQNVNSEKKIVKIYSEIGLSLGLILFMFSLGILFGFITYTVIGLKTMIKKIGNSSRKAEIISGSCETPKKETIKRGE